MTTERVALFCVMGELHIGAGYAGIAVAIEPPRPFVIPCEEVMQTCRCCCCAQQICGETPPPRTAGYNSMCKTRIRCWLPFINVNWNGVPRSDIRFPCFRWSGYSYFVRPDAPPTKPHPV
jgi:hypothetical protein